MRRITCFALLLTTAVSVSAAPEFAEQFLDNYEALSVDLLNQPAERFEVTDFVYQKDVATFTFASGTIYLMRYVDDRPTTALFLGSGQFSADIPFHAERQAMWYASGDSVVADDFEFCFIRFADDFDIQLRERFTPDTTTLGHRDYTKYKQAQGEFFFRPVVMHKQDNYFQLLRSQYERSADGYFWADINRYVYVFDPNQASEVEIRFEREGGDIESTIGATFRRESERQPGDSTLSRYHYDLQPVAKRGSVTLGDLDGMKIDAADITMDLRVVADSLRFAKLYIHHNLKLDSLRYNDDEIGLMRRRDFSTVGVMLPDYVYRDDTISLRFFYHGNDFSPGFPFIESNMPTPYDLTMIYPRDFSYLVPGLTGRERTEGRFVQSRVQPDRPFRVFAFQGMLNGWDTVQVIASNGMPITILQNEGINKKRFECYVPLSKYEPPVTHAINYLTTRFGPPGGVFGLTIYPEPDGGFTMPGMARITQDYCLIDGTGQLSLVAGREIARQWFGPTAYIQTDREQWILDGAVDYLGIMVVEDTLGTGISFAELKSRRSEIIKMQNDNDLQPLAGGHRVMPLNRVLKGAWVYHMLRFMMYDPSGGGDQTYLRFMRELALTLGSQPVSNHRFQQIAEKHVGESLDWFFATWLYGRSIPSGNVTYEVVPAEEGYQMTVTSSLNRVASSFRMPVWLRVQFEDGTSELLSREVRAGAESFTIGPFAKTPDRLVFNEFFSMLADIDVDKR